MRLTRESVRFVRDFDCGRGFVLTGEDVARFVTAGQTREGPLPEALVLLADSPRLDQLAAQMTTAGWLVQRLPEDAADPVEQVAHAVGVLRVSALILCGYHDSPLPPPADAAEDFVAQTRARVQANVQRITRTRTALLQRLQQLRSLPIVAEAESRGELALHVWLYLGDSGTLLYHTSDQGWQADRVARAAHSST